MFLPGHYFTPMLPPPFERQMQDLLGPEYAGFVAALEHPPPVSVRLNARKMPLPPATIAGLGPVGGVPWHPQGYYLPERPVFTLDPLLHAGAYYVQEASSMFLYEALRQTLPDSKAPRILDMCAAPGGKSTLLQAFSQAGGLLVSNEYVRSRVSVLRENLERWGEAALAVTSADAEAFAALEDWFDVVAVDAPCSGEGLFRKDPDAMREWSPAAVENCAFRQQHILKDAVEALAPGGILLYSTCTYNRLENQDNANWLCSRFPLEIVHLDIPESWGILDTGAGYQFFPHRLQGEGFFLSVLRKKDGPAKRLHPASVFQHLRPLPKSQVPALEPWVASPDLLRFYLTPQNEVIAIPRALEEDFLMVDKVSNSKWFGVKMGAFKGKDFIPDHALALSTLRSPTLPHVNFNRDQALLYLKREALELPAGAPKGWALAAYENLPLGWMKILPNRMNNYLPQERRIRMEIGRA
jgi:16S rRNA C967 or C1407 C5-methylase (RsmB/RsmF family)/NOL1/NOP2/fmu family ribosome biogenesis protein